MDVNTFFQGKFQKYVVSNYIHLRKRKKRKKKNGKQKLTKCTLCSTYESHIEAMKDRGQTHGRTVEQRGAHFSLLVCNIFMKPGTCNNFQCRKDVCFSIGFFHVLLNFAVL